MFPITIENLVDNIRNKDCPNWIKKENALCLCQVVYDGMLEQMLDQPSLLNKTFKVASEVCAKFYIPGYNANVNERDLDYIKKTTRKFKIDIKFRPLNGSEDCVKDFIRSVVKYYKEHERPDVIISIASGGFEPALVLSKVLNTPHTTLRFSHHYRNDENVKLLPFQEMELKEKIPNSNVLLIDDWIESGRTINKVTDFLNESYAPRTITVGIVLNSYNTIFNPVMKFPFKIVRYEANFQDKFCRI
ncbi:MAG: phosphoribosyltransferase [Candidatus Parvarchaeota archaeon]|nr:phosphoribosyltransferase [Candidatus Jingweiarchaeum tengchongense]MCW1298158.1 phosphoribosyltransferase [Candidatus Jingweiarchaeum tengchongense]MCW1299956.1 phosphoribosyltransferase [Candidatus Jingweiarchaeum tengchongense]MCW1305059.1 phosphoribosyltransferase [Candidatus Jingweiarchaeum tengchongense]MCW1305578.1 phosphoribosyltransferase [Candidatus Jingweiarchaeum tengchongense]